MFNKEGFEKLGEDIYVYHNFVTEDECNNLVKIAESVEEHDWHGRFNTSGEGHKWSNRSIDELIPIHNRIKSLLHEGIGCGGRWGCICEQAELLIHRCHCRSGRAAGLLGDRRACARTVATRLPCRDGRGRSTRTA